MLQTMETMTHFSLMDIKGGNIFELQNICNIKNVFTVTFDQFNTFVLIEQILISY